MNYLWPSKTKDRDAKQQQPRDTADGSAVFNFKRNDDVQSSLEVKHRPLTAEETQDAAKPLHELICFPKSF
jgi:hypothetical protein